MTTAKDNKDNADPIVGPIAGGMCLPPARYIIAADGKQAVRLEEIGSLGVDKFGSLWVVTAYRKGDSWQSRVPPYGIRLAERATDHEAQIVLRKLVRLLDPQAVALE